MPDGGLGDGGDADGGSIFPTAASRSMSRPCARHLRRRARLQVPGRGEVLRQHVLQLHRRDRARLRVRRQGRLQARANGVPTATRAARTACKTSCTGDVGLPCRPTSATRSGTCKPKKNDGVTCGLELRVRAGSARRQVELRPGQASAATRTAAIPGGDCNAAGNEGHVPVLASGGDRVRGQLQSCTTPTPTATATATTATPGNAAAAAATPRRPAATSRTTPTATTTTRRTSPGASQASRARRYYGSARARGRRLLRLQLRRRRDEAVRRVVPARLRRSAQLRSDNTFGHATSAAARTRAIARATRATATSPRAPRHAPLGDEPTTARYNCMRLRWDSSGSAVQGSRPARWSTRSASRRRSRAARFSGYYSAARATARRQHRHVDQYQVH